MERDELVEASLRLMRISAAVYVTTIDKLGNPVTRAMLNLRNRSDYPKLVRFFAAQKPEFVGFFTTSTSSEKLQHIKKHPYVSVYYCDPAKYHGLMLGGEMQIIDDLKIKKELWQKGWEQYYPGGFDDPDHTVLKLIPSVARGWYKSATFTFDLKK